MPIDVEPAASDRRSSVERLSRQPLGSEVGTRSSRYRYHPDDDSTDADHRPRSRLDPYRLPTGARPTRYDVQLRPALDDGHVHRHGRDQLDIDADTDILVLNAAELGDRGVRDRRDRGDLGARRARRADDRHAGRHRRGRHVSLSIAFDGILNDKLHGFYRSTYIDDDGNEQVIATTQMQATDCRRAFPCWDEPDFKAVFSITLVVDDDLTAISNGPEVERTTADGRTVIRFADTMVMSTLPRRLRRRPSRDDRPDRRRRHPAARRARARQGPPHRLRARRRRLRLRWFQEYYGIAYPSDKVDLVALPDFAAGAMENLGCITFRENLLLVDPATSTQDEQQFVADVVAHELAHMWFGDLVTMRWWNGIWLNEAFATFMEVAACDAYRPDWERWTSFGVERSGAFDVDSLASTRTVEFEVRSPADCDGMFDVLTYQKGGALLRMLEQYLGDDRFREGVSHYLRTPLVRQHRDQRPLGRDRGDVGRTRAADHGHVDLAARLPARDGLAGRRRSLDAVQRRFRFEPTAPAGRPALGDSRPGPQRRRHDDRAARRRHESTDRDRRPRRHRRRQRRRHGFYRVDYDDTLREPPRRRRARRLTTLERYNLVDDAWAATLAGRLAAAELLLFLEAFGKRARPRCLAGDRHRTPWPQPAARRRRRHDAFQQRVRPGRPGADDLGEPHAGESDLTGKLAACSPVRWASSAATSASRHAAVHSSTPRAPIPARSIPSSRPPPQCRRRHR